MAWPGVWIIYDRLGRGVGIWSGHGSGYSWSFCCNKFSLGRNLCWGLCRCRLLVLFTFNICVMGKYILPIVLIFVSIAALMILRHHLYWYVFFMVLAGSNIGRIIGLYNKF